MTRGGCHACGSKHVYLHALHVSMPAVFAHMKIRRTGDTLFASCRTCLYRDMTCHPVCQSVCEPSASQADSPRGFIELLWGPRRCEGFTEHAMASGAAASNKGEAPRDAHWLSLTWGEPLKSGVMLWIC